MAGMRMVYMRLAPGLWTEARQREALGTYGATPEEMGEPWIDRGKPKHGDPGERGRMLGAMRDGDEVLVAQLGVLGSRDDDIIEYVRQASAMGAAIRDASTGERYYIPPYCRDAADSALRLVQAIKRSERGAVLSKARASRKAPAGKPKIPEDKLLAARADWFDHSISEAEFVAKRGISGQTMRRRFGKRGSPAFGKALNKQRGKA